MGSLSCEILGAALITLGKRIRAGKCMLTQEQFEHIAQELERALDVELSKEQACSMLGISRSTFDAKVAAGQLPRGRHVRGLKELRWSNRELTYGDADQAD